MREEEAGKAMYDLEQRRLILRIAREAVRQELRKEPLIDAEIPDGADFLEEPRGCFVSLHTREGRLRGCIGTFMANRPLAENLVEMGAAVTRDPRFVYNPVTPEELGGLLVEVSILTPMEEMPDPLSLKIGEEGIYVTAKVDGVPVGGCFLPQVATEQGWGAEEMVSYCCSHKMGLAPDVWRHPQAGLKFYRFKAVVVKEREPGEAE